MIIFTGFIFWLYAVEVVGKLLSVAALPYPKTVQKTMGQEVIGLVIMLVVMAWAGLLHFGLIDGGG